jgi:GNAT superfamily N-acetyltransferase
MDQPVNPSDIIGRKRRRGFTGGPSRYARGVGQVSVRPAASNDIPPLLALVRRYWEFEGVAGFTALRIELVLQRLLAEPRLGAIWVAESDARLVGYLIAVLVLSVEHQGLMGEIDEFFVLPEARTSGIGTQLLAAAETALAARGCVRLQLQLGVGNSAARAFYQHRGYTARAGYELLDKPLSTRA